MSYQYNCSIKHLDDKNKSTETLLLSCLISVFKPDSM